MICRFYLGIGFADCATRADQIADAIGSAGIRVCGCAISNRNRQVFIRKQIKRKILFFLKPLVLRWWVIADANNDGIVVSKLLDSITEPLPLASSAGGTGSGIKPENYVLIGII